MRLSPEQQKLVLDDVAKILKRDGLQPAPDQDRVGDEPISIEAADTETGSLFGEPAPVPEPPRRKKRRGGGQSAASPARSAALNLVQPEPEPEEEEESWAGTREDFPAE